MNEDGRLFALPGSPAATMAEALGWLWRLGPVLADPSPDAVGAYSEGALRAAAARGLTSWLPAALAPMLGDTTVHETTNNAFRSMHRLGYGHLSGLAADGLPATPVLHGGLLDQRLHHLKRNRDLPTAARLFFRRDLIRLARLRAVRWIAGDELVPTLRAHDTVRVKGPEVDVGEASLAMMVNARGVRPATEG